MEHGYDGPKSAHSVRKGEMEVNNEDESVNSSLESSIKITVQESKAVSNHCLICDVTLCESEESSYNIFGQLKISDSSRASVFEKVGQILSRNLHSINLHSEVVCSRCFNLLIEYEETKCKLHTIRLDLITKFDITANKHQESLTNVQLEEVKLHCNSSGNGGGDSSSSSKNNNNNNNNNNNEIKSKTRQSSCQNDTRMLVITEEGKVVDRNGKEKEAIVDRRKIRSKGKLNISNSAKPKPYVCSVCGKGFRAFSHRVEHMLIHLGEKPWSCVECNKTFRTKSALRVHSMKHTGHRPYSCQECGKSFLDRYYFEEHCRIHSGERPFICTYCQRPFARKKDLAIHTKNHTGDKPYKCISCPKSFAVKSRLDRHMRIHSGEKPHCCEYCGKSFARRDDYKVHVRLHTGERPFRCAVCSRTFTNQSNCLVHMRIHEGSKQRYPCPICSESFDRRSKVNKHVTVHHSDVSSKQSETKNQSTTDLPTGEQSSQLQLDTQIQSLTPVQLQPLTQVQVDSFENPSLPHSDAANHPQPLFHAETLQSLTVSDLHTLQTLPITQVAQLEWTDGTAAGTTTTYVNITPGTYVNIIN